MKTTPENPLLTRRKAVALFNAHGVPCYNSKFKAFIDAGLLTRVKLATCNKSLYKQNEVMQIINPS